MSSSLNAINNMIGEYPLKIPIALFGRTMSGKTILAIQEALYCASQLGGDVLYIGTEGGEDLFIKQWVPVLSQRFNTSVKFHLLQARSIEALLKIHGLQIELVLKQRIDVRFTGEVEDEVSKLIKNRNIKVIVYDSLSNPLKIAFPSERQNFPARASALNMLMNKIQDIATDNDILVFGIHHASFDPSLTQGQAGGIMRPHISGGDAVCYNTKIILALLQTSSRITNVRRIYLVRFFNKPEWSESAFIEIKNDGWWDINE